MCLHSFIKSKHISVYDSKGKARILNSQFVSVFSVDKGDIPTIYAKYAENLITNTHVNS